MGEVIFMPPNEKLRYDANACSKSATKSLGSGWPGSPRGISKLYKNQHLACDVDFHGF